MVLESNAHCVRCQRVTVMVHVAEVNARVLAYVMGMMSESNGYGVRELCFLCYRVTVTVSQSNGYDFSSPVAEVNARVLAYDVVYGVC
jgi:hypothetical protein